MRRSICAQSAASMPPAPELIETMAGSGSFSPESMRRHSISASASSTTSPACSASFAVASSLASSARSMRTRASSSARSCLANASSVPFSSFCSRSTCCAASRFSQNDGSAALSSSSETRLFLPSMSKVPPELVELVLEPGEVGLDALDVEVRGGHGYSLTLLRTAEADDLGALLGLERHGVLPREAGGAVAAARAPGELRRRHGVEQALDAEIAERVAGHVAGDLERRVRGGDELGARRRVDAVVARVRRRRRADAQVHLARAGGAD